MKFRQMLAILVLLSGLGACATYYDDGAYYDDGSYYSPADGDEGDYYYAPEPRYHHYYNYDLFFGYPYYGHGYFGGWYGSSFYRYDGYCSVRYRYCPPFASYGHYAPYPRFGLSIQFGDPWYYGRRHYRDGDGYGHGYGRGRGGERWTRPRRPGAPAAAPPQPDAGAPALEPTPEQAWQIRQDAENPWPRRQPRRDPRADLESDDPDRVVDADEAGTPTPRWRAPARRPATGVPAPRAASGAPAPRAPAPAAREPRASDGDDEASPRRSRRGRDTDADTDGRN